MSNEVTILIHKTNACRLLNQKKLAYTLHEYPVDEKHLDAVHVASETGQNPAKIYKTLVTIGDKTGYAVAAIPANKSLNLKAFAKISGNKKVEMIHVNDLEKITGYIRGGCSPIGMKKAFPTFIDQAAKQFDTIFISAGKRGLQIEMNADDLLLATRGQYADISVEQ
ncbi:Cys-tRNA(Pro)/Cys-tRNA(Cys) deacylase ybaK [Listeria fleischmannii subsp. coloradonensis]|nr:Cys-tRNA(Pro)/Cys-tRNA(Cys) deacylase ybaK [Listeria fleischmannii subsp. coloradonensis]